MLGKQGLEAFSAGCLRRCLGNIFNSYLEMPFGVAFMLVWFLVVTAVLCVLWARHYNESQMPR